jgi:hypothetical protein
MIRAKIRKRDGKNGKRPVAVRIRTKEIGEVFSELEAILMSVEDGIRQIKDISTQEKAKGWLKAVAYKYAKTK